MVADVDPDPSAFDPGVQVLLECGRPEPRYRLLSRLVNAELHWPSLLDRAALHGMLPLLCARAIPLRFADVPDATCERLRSALSTNAKKNLILTSELLNLVSAFERAGIPVLSFKGPALAWSIYASPELREYSDLDLLVRREDFHAAKRLLAERGYGHGVRDIPPRHLAWNTELPLANQRSGIRVDLHWKPVAPHLPLLTPELFWAGAAPVVVAGRPILTFAPEATFLHLCLHGTGHSWHSLKWLVDLAHLAHAFPLDWDRILTQAGTLRVSRSVLLAMRLTRDLLGVPFPSSGPPRVLLPAGACAVARGCLLSGWPRQGRFPAMLFNLPFTERFGDKCLLFASMLQPTPADLAAAHFPASLRLLYYPLRLLRILSGCLFVAKARFVGLVTKLARTERRSPKTGFGRSKALKNANVMEERT